MLLLVIEDKILVIVGVVIKCIRTKRSIHRSIVDENETVSIGDASVSRVNKRRKILLCEIQLLYLELTAEACLYIRVGKVGDINVIKMFLMGSLGRQEPSSC